MRIIGQAEISPAEFERHQWEVENRDAQLAHVKAVRSMELEGMRIEAKITAWFRIPVIIITLPVRILSIIPLCIYAATKQEVPEFYRNLMR